VANKLVQQNKAKNIENLLFLDQTALSKAAINCICFICFCWWKCKRMAKKELFLIELVTYLFKKMMAWKTLKNDNQTYIQTQKTVHSHCQTWKIFPQPTITIIKERRKKFVREMINFFNFFVPLTIVMVNCCVPSLPAYCFHFASFFTLLHIPGTRYHSSTRCHSLVPGIIPCY